MGGLLPRERVHRGGEVKLTKRGFLQSLGSAIAAGAVADKTQITQAAMVECGPPMALNAPVGWGSGGLASQCQPFMPAEWSWPSWKAKERSERKRRFLQDADPAMRRSGQFTSHEQKKQRWLMKREYRRFMGGPWRGEWQEPETIQQWKQKQTVATTLEDLRGKLEALAQSNPTPRY